MLVALTNLQNRQAHAEGPSFILNQSYKRKVMQDLHDFFGVEDLQDRSNLISEAFYPIVTDYLLSLKI